MRIYNLSGIFSGQGFVNCDGRRPKFTDCGYLNGPIDVVYDQGSGLIQGIEPTNKSILNSREPFIDGTGLVATAGFVDSHTHAIFAGTRSEEYFLRWSGATYAEVAAKGGGIHNTTKATSDASDFDLLELTKDRLSQMMRLGSTTVEIKSGYGTTGADEIRLLRILRTLQVSPQLPRIYKTFLGLHALPKKYNEKEFVDEMISALSVVSQEKLADFVDAFPERGFFSLSEAQRFTKSAARLGIPSKIHADELSDLGSTEAFVNEKSLSVDHLQKISQAGIKALANSNTVATFLPATSFFLGLEYTNARAIINAGARFALATDYNPGTAPELSMPFTLKLAAAQLKLSPAEILCGATFGGAAALGAEKTFGTLTQGKSADILLWSTHHARAETCLDDICLGQAALKKVIVRGNPLA